MVAGMTLAETGQETPLKIEEKQYRNQALESRSLSVIRANSPLGKQCGLNQALANGNILPQICPNSLSHDLFPLPVPYSGPYAIHCMHKCRFELPNTESTLNEPK
jgi:hypothetical protein